MDNVAGHDVACVALQLDIVIGELAQLHVVDTSVFVLGGHAQAQAGNEVEQEQDHAREHE